MNLLGFGWKSWYLYQYSQGIGVELGLLGLFVIEKIGEMVLMRLS